jgi:hypothetical protein
VAAITRPVLSTTPLATNEVSYSIHSLSAGDVELATATRIVAAVVELRLHILTDTTEKVLDGTVYIVVLAVVVILAVPNLPVAIFFSVNYLKSNSMQQDIP